MYLGFDWLPTYQRDIADAVATKNMIEILETYSNVPRQSKNFIEKHVTDVLNNERKLINNMTLSRYNITYTITRSGLILEKATANKSSRKKKYFYNWMLCGELVSK